MYGETPTKSLLGLKIRALRRAKGWNQRELAEQANLTQSAVSAYELGARHPTKIAWKALATALETTVTALRNGQPHNGTAPVPAPVPASAPAPIQQGWQCPLCAWVYAPFVLFCGKCSGE